MFRLSFSDADRAPVGRASTNHRSGRALGAIFLLLVLLASGSVVASWGSNSNARVATTSLNAADSAADSSSPPCYALNGTLCVSMVNSSEPNIIPLPGSHSTTVEPSSNSTLSLYLKSMKPLVWATAKGSGATTPIQLNATGTLWDGDPYWNATSGTVWHPTGASWWTFGPTGTNLTYPYWYGLNFSAHSSTGSPNFFPGMRLTWWLYIVSNDSGTYSHWSSLNFSFTFAGAWPFSPDPGAAQYAGPNASSGDIAVFQNPLRPNWNDSVNITVATTDADALPGASIGGAYLAYTEYAPDGAILAAATLTFPVTLSGTVGAEITEVHLPPSLAHNPNALVKYQITAWDTNTYGPDQIETGSYNYTVNGNGTFQDHIFSQDLSLLTTPRGPGLGSTASVPAGTSVQLLLSSKNAGVSIYAAQVVYNVTYSAINETAHGSIAFGRLNSTNFFVSLPAMPLGAQVSFVVLAWDFAQTRDNSSQYSYSTPSVASLEQNVPTNLTFFMVYVYDNGTHRWVSGATVTIVGSAGYVRSTGTTFNGVAYPNATAQPFVPILVPAGESYKISVSDPSFLPTGGSSSNPPSITLYAPHDLTTDGVLYVGSTYEVAQSGNAVYFWLNQTAPSASYSAPVALDSAPLIGAGLGLAAIALCLIPLMAWWSRIRAHRLAQEKRITL
jgi:hypothetical protein